VVPPVAAKVAEYAVLTTPPGKDVVVIESGGVPPLMVRGRALLTGGVCVVSRIVTVTVNWPAAAGVPVIWPVVELIVRGEGSPDALQVYGGVPPPPSIVNEYGVFTVPGGRADVWMRSGPPCAKRFGGAKNNESSDEETRSEMLNREIAAKRFSAIIAVEPPPMAAHSAQPREV
jgi:hypothetical protein